MAITSSVVSLGLSAVSAGVGAYSAYSSAQAQNKAQAQQAQQVQQQNMYNSLNESRNADTALKNAELATLAGRAAAREGHENKLKKRQEVAGIVGSQRAAQGASGAIIDTGSFLDVNLDTVEKGEIDALALEQEGFDIQYQRDMEAYNFTKQAEISMLNSAQYATSSSSGSYTNPLLSGAASLIGSAANIGSNYYRMTR